MHCQNTDQRPYVIVSDGPASSGYTNHVLDPANWQEPARFATQREARAYADSILPEMPSKYLPLRVTREAQS